MTPRQNPFPFQTPGTSLRKVALVATLAVLLPACTTMQNTEFASNDGDLQPHSLQHEDIDAAFAQGLRYLNDGNAAAAEQSFARVLKIKPKNAEASIGLAEAYLSQGRFDDALTTFRKVSDNPKHRAIAAQGQGLALFLKGHRALAKARLEDAVAEEPTLWRAWSALGQFHDAQRMWVEAEACYRAALKGNPDAASVYNNLGMSYLTQERTEEALIKFEEALLVDPSLDPARANRQITLSILGRYNEALENTAEEHRHIALNNVGYIAMTRGDLKQAHDLLNRSADLSPVYYAVAEQNLDRVEQALSQQQVLQ